MECKLDTAREFINTILGFNRNIVECKLSFLRARMLGRFCFNRNIVECKCRGTPLKEDVLAVLIETLWNVNIELLWLHQNKKLGFNRNIVECKCSYFIGEPVVYKCFNRNIVECKSNRRLQRPHERPVLIETLWNVN